MAKLPSGFVDTANERRKKAKRFLSNWRNGARDAYSFIAGDQWLQEDITILTAQRRPPITFNYSEKMIDAVVGAEVSSRQEVLYAPRDISDGPLAEMETNAARWVRDQTNMEDEESDAFRDALICGLGWTHTRISYEEDPQGIPVTDRIDPLEMSYDPAATKPSLADRRYSFRDMWIDERQAKKQWPRAIFITGEYDNAPGVDVIDRARRYKEDDATEPDNHQDEVLITHYECVELEPYFLVATENGEAMPVESDAFSKLQKDFDKRGVKYVRMHRKVYYYAYFSGEKLLEGDQSPTQKGFTYQAITGKRDRNKNTWYGLTKVMMDPQRWANKWLSQILHIINSNAKGGLFAEKNAFVDPARAMDDYASPDTIVFLNEGAIDKIEQKQQAAYPSGLDKLMEFALASLPQVTGINLEALGLAAREQANVLEQSRKQAAFGLLAPVFDSLRRYRKYHGRILLDFINKYISDGRMIRIGGPESQQFVELRKVPDIDRYDIIVDQSPTAPDVKRETWSILETLLPAAMKAGMPVPPTILKYAPIPTALAVEWEQYVQSTQGQMNPEMVKKIQEENVKVKEENQKLQMQLKDKSQELQMKFQEMQEELKMKWQELVFEFKAKMAEMQQEAQLKQVESQSRVRTQEALAASQIQQADRTTDSDIQNSERMTSAGTIKELIGAIQALDADDKE